MQNFSEYVNESGEAGIKDTKAALADKSFKDGEALRVAVLNRERTNWDTSWQADYFYGEHKAMSKKQSELVVKAMIDLENILIEKGVKKSRISSDVLVKIYLGNTRPVDYFKDMK